MAFLTKVSQDSVMESHLSSDATLPQSLPTVEQDRSKVESIEDEIDDDGNVIEDEDYDDDNDNEEDEEEEDEEDDSSFSDYGTQFEDEEEDLVIHMNEQVEDVEALEAFSKDIQSLIQESLESRKMIPSTQFDAPLPMSKRILPKPSISHLSTPGSLFWDKEKSGSESRGGENGRRIDEDLSLGNDDVDGGGEEEEGLVQFTLLLKKGPKVNLQKSLYLPSTHSIVSSLQVSVENQRKERREMKALVLGFERKEGQVTGGWDYDDNDGNQVTLPAGQRTIPSSGMTFTSSPGRSRGRGGGGGRGSSGRGGSGSVKSHGTRVVRTGTSTGMRWGPRPA